MKTWIVTLPFLCTVGVAMAQGVEKEGGADQPQAAAAPAERAAARIAATAAQAESTSMPSEPVAAPAEPTATPGKAKAPVKAKAPAKARSRSRMGKRKTLPTGDMRHCLDLKTRAETIRCAETWPKK